MNTSADQAELDNISQIIATAVGGNMPKDAAMISLVFRIKNGRFSLSLSSDLNDDAILPALRLCLHTLTKGIEGNQTLDAYKVADVANDGEVTHYDNNGKPILKN